MKDVLQEKPLKTPSRNSFFYTKRPDLPSRKLLMVPELKLDVCLISHDAYYRNQKRASNYLQRYLNQCSFSVMLLNRAIENVLQLKNEATREQILAKLPLNYADFVDVFSKSQNNELPPYRSSDHKIELLPDATPLRAHPLYSMSTEQLVAFKEYLTENFRKEWIIPSGAEYNSPVLFAKKPNDGLRLCVNYRKLNTRTRKNTYSLPLIEKTLKCISRAHIYTKLDIRQAFNRIRMSEKSENLTIFRTRFG
jgi:hypothetical protein